MMNWEQKLEAMNALCDHSLMMRKPGDWYVNTNLEIEDGGVCIGAYGNGKTPQEAIEDHWNLYTTIQYPKCIYIRNMSGDNRFRWNGYMWKKA